MGSIEVFARNVKRQLRQKRMRIKDLAELVGVSDSYLSLVLSGARHNLSDHYKDRMAMVLGTTLAELYTNDEGSQAAPDMEVLLALELGAREGGRPRQAQALEDWLHLAHLPSTWHPALYRAFSRLNDEEARVVAGFLSAVVEDWTGREEEEARPLERSWAAWQGLPAMSREALLGVAVLGSPTPVREVAALLGCDDAEILSGFGLADGWGRLVDHPQGLEAELASPGVRQAVLRWSAPERRRVLHQEAARLLQDRPQLDADEVGRLAQHCLRAGDLERALEHMQGAGDRAFAQHHYRPALNYYSQALALARVLRRTSLLPDIGYQLSLTYGQLGQWKEAITHAEGARAQFAADGDASSEIICLTLLGSLYTSAHDLTEAGLRLDQALTLAAAVEDDRLTCRLLHHQAVIRLQEGRWSEAHAQLNTAWESAQRQADPQLQAEIMLALGWLKLEQEQVEAALTRLHQAVALARDASNERLMARAQYYLGHAWGELDDLAEARQAFAACRQLARHTQDDRLALRAQLELVARDSGSLPQRIQATKENMRQLTLLRDGAGEVRAGAVLAEFLVCAHQPEQGRRVLRQVTELAEERGEWRSLTLALQGHVAYGRHLEDDTWLTLFSRRLGQLLPAGGKVYPGV